MEPPEPPPMQVPAPPFVWPVAVLNAVQRLCRTWLGVNLLSIPEAALLEALRAAGNAEGVAAVFGPQDDVERAATLLVRGFNSQPLSLFGRLFLRTILFGLAKTRAVTMQTVLSTPSICDEVIRKPIFIVGLPRTASTLLYNLLALDPDARAPRQWEMSPFFDLLPLSTRSGIEDGTDPRIEQMRRSDAELDDIAYGFNARVRESHPSDPAWPDEDIYAMTHQMMLSFFLPITGPAFQAWMLDADKDVVYHYHKRFLQLLQSSWAPASHWVLKTPEHACYLRSLLKHFPDARFVVTHRALEFVLPSMCRLWETIAAVAMDDQTLNRAHLGELACTLADTTVKRMHEVRTATDAPIGPHRFCDVHYDDIVHDPVAVVRRIYKQFGMRVSPEHARKIRQFMEENPQGKHGRAPYSPEAYNLDVEDIRKRYAYYEHTYNCAHPKDRHVFNL